KLTVVSSHFDAPSAPPAQKPAAAGAGADGTAPAVTLPEGPAIDLEQLESACMGLPALRSSLLHTYLIDVPGRLERLRFAFDANDLRRVEFEAHGLRGMCATNGAMGCTMLFGEIEDRARADRLEDSRALLEPAIEEALRAEQFIRRFDAIVQRDAA